MPAPRRILTAATIAAAITGIAATGGRAPARPEAAWCTIHSTTVGVDQYSVSTPEITYPCP
ncbi:MAG TPA: hypothetical protein VFQ85_12935 [Mycobacteriales bacterium]|jgi:hypothetical protein|nr:hypothetical protein [Mycobacteriales bacterium]